MAARIESIDYGKGGIPAYRFKAAPLSGVREIPESQFTGRQNRVFGAEVDVKVLGENFIPAYTKGDNSNVVATDTMKNFVLSKTLEWEGATIESLLSFLGSEFLSTYAQMESIIMTGRELPYVPHPVPSENGFEASTVLHSQSRDDYSVCEISLEREGDDILVTEVNSGRCALHLLKTTGSSFLGFVRDEHTTLPQVQDRPLFIHLDIYWEYGDISHAVGDSPENYIPGEQIRDLAAVVFHEFNSKSIQHLVHEIAVRALKRFPQMAEVRLEAENRLWDPAFADEQDPLRMVRTDPRPPFGTIGLTMHQDESRKGGR